MEQRDYIKRQIEQIGIVIGAILGYIMRLGPGQSAIAGIDHVRTSLKDELDIDLDALLSSPASETVGLLESKGFDFERMERFREMLIRLSDRLPEQNPVKEQIEAFADSFEKAIELRSGTIRLENLF